MFKEDKANLSLYYHLKTTFSGIVDVFDSYPPVDLLIPSLSIDLVTINFSKFEIGNYNNIREIHWVIDIYAKNKTQRNSIAYKCFESLENSIPVYDYDINFPPPNPPQLGILYPENLKIDFVSVEVDKPEDLFYRGVGIYIAKLELNS